MDLVTCTAADVPAAYALYAERCAWLRARGIRQWLAPLPEEEFLSHAQRGQLFALREGAKIAAIAIIVCRVDHDWTQVIGPEPHWWIETLAVGRAAAGCGREFLARCEAHIRDFGGDEVWLDCHAGFLPGYYTRAGYTELARKDITYPSGNTYPMVLMRKRFGDGGELRVES